MGHILFTPLLMDTWVVSTFWVLWVMLNHVSIGAPALDYSGDSPRGGIAGSQANSMCNSLRNCQTLPQHVTSAGLKIEHLKSAVMGNWQHCGTERAGKWKTSTRTHEVWWCLCRHHPPRGWESTWKWQALWPLNPSLDGAKNFPKASLNMELKE